MSKMIFMSFTPEVTHGSDNDIARVDIHVGLVDKPDKICIISSNS